MRNKFLIFLSLTILTVNCHYQMTIANLVEKTGWFEMLFVGSISIDEKSGDLEKGGMAPLIVFHCIEDERSYSYEELKNCQYDLPKEDLTEEGIFLQTGEDYLYLVKGFLGKMKRINNVILQNRGLGQLPIFKTMYLKRIK